MATRRNLNRGLSEPSSVIRLVYEDDPLRWSASFRQLVEEIIAEVVSEKPQ